jgi:hypothetical protein
MSGLDAARSEKQYRVAWERIGSLPVLFGMNDEGGIALGEYAISLIGIMS